MVGAQQSRDDNTNMQWDDPKRDPEPPIQDEFLEIQIRMLAPGENAPRIACLAYGSLDERAKIATALQAILDTEPTFVA